MPNQFGMSNKVYIFKTYNVGMLFVQMAPSVFLIQASGSGIYAPAQFAKLAQFAPFNSLSVPDYLGRSEMRDKIFLACFHKMIPIIKMFASRKGNCIWHRLLSLSPNTCWG